MKRLLGIILIISVCSLLFTPFILAEDIPNPQFDLKAKSAILMEAKSGRILYEKNSHEELPPASITKIMTLLLTMEAIDEGRAKLDDVVSTSEHASSMGGSQIWLEPGEEMTLKEMIKAIAIVSANDACVAVAEYLYGTQEAFVDAMNKKAKELGMKDTYFVNTNGLPPTDPEMKGNYTSAHDVALMSRELINNYPQVLEYTKVWIDYLRDGDSFLRNTNNLVRFYNGADGLKTGYTSEAGYCVSATAQREGLRFISVVMQEDNSKVRFNEAGKLLSYGFNIYRSIKVIKKGEVAIDQIEVYKGKEPMIKAVAKEDLNAAVIRGNEDKLTKQIVIKDDLMAPLKAGDKVGEIRVLANNKVIAKTDLVSNRDVEKGNIIQIIIQLLRKFLMNIVNLFS
ncbi:MULTISPECIES: D-alanyl-D-alanine carboxypeptidase family protein [unclassified Candidatus Frackibacter]|uniref:D-alanyl-D-alanine carboxypeptidase family protein n=1 Tax=unclassified Candidatus Frackibacter TaxID=2648818 RepID=UPI0007911769|nr:MULTISPECIES: D-alanyl-D-alanine carboxypeptidase family protein [unclassified Candidatus Frackibacter]KXS43666.1 MAG: D-alanyl-D-alanine carboxypeptidase (penicillin-binding protein 5/6) [Candidatus Frackibacter sp. T328-2]SDC01940.1 D-alanyl-D-alanine carboxypeptidase (penicillin-binding protein 5/6) [Candidatus Frackibacter sp. WG11]SEM33145.1 D-alanyl-D-alanine carboxypeptidase (penicillin-binding protein 5/6) [Candidatus Frackibacter sp. WG12]SFL38138.1 D-alanyl-D-alanine carboxypeptida